MREPQILEGASSLGVVRRVESMAQGKACSLRTFIGSRLKDESMEGRPAIGGIVAGSDRAY